MDPKIQMFVCEGRSIAAITSTFDGEEIKERMRVIWGNDATGPLDGKVSIYSVDNAPTTMIAAWRSKWGWEADVIDGRNVTTLSSPCRTRGERSHLLDILLVKMGVTSRSPRLRLRFRGDCNVAAHLIGSRID